MKALRFSVGIMTTLVAVGTVYETVTDGRPGLIFAGLAIALWGIFTYALWDDYE